MDFYEWMMQYKGHDTPRGDLAGDMARKEREFPKDGDYDQILSHLEGSHACKEAIRAFKSAWKSYTATMR